MQVKQVYQLVNDITQQYLGDTAVLAEDLSNIVDVGTALFRATDVDNYVKSLVDRIAKVIFVTRPYSGNVPSVLMDSFEYGAVVQKIDADMPVATTNSTWALVDGQDYNPNIFHQPSVSVKFFNNKYTFEVEMSFTERQVRESFASASEVNSFITMLYNAVEKSFTVKIDGLIMSTINNMIGETLHADNTGLKAVNLLDKYKTAFPDDADISKDNALTSPEFIRYASMTMGLYIDRLSRMSTLFNVGGKAKFTPANMLHVVMLSEFKASANSYLQSDTFHNEFTALPDAETVPFWHGSGTDFDFDSTSKINVNLASDNSVTVAQTGILAVMFDTEALGVCNLERRVTTNYNPKGEFFNNFYKLEAGSFNDLNENFVVFYIDED